MTPQTSKRAFSASGTRVQNLASIVGHATLFAPPTAVVWCFTIGSFIGAPLVVKQAEAALEDTAWAAGRVLAAGIALTHLFERTASHDRISADDAVGVEATPTRAPIIIVPQPDIRAPPLSPRPGGEPPKGKPKRKHLHGSRQPDTSLPPPGRLPDTLMPAPVPHRDLDGAP